MHLKPSRGFILTRAAPFLWLEVENASLFFIPNSRITFFVLIVFFAHELESQGSSS